MERGRDRNRNFNQYVVLSLSNSNTFHLERPSGQIDIALRSVLQTLSFAAPSRFVYLTDIDSVSDVAL